MWLPLGPHRRWILGNAVLGAAVVNLVVNAGIAWLSVRGRRTVPLWSLPLPVYKVGFAVGLGALVTPVIAVRAMADDPSSARSPA